MESIQTLSRELQEVDSVITKHKGTHGELLGILEEAQILNENKYLSEDTLNHVALKTGVPLSRIYNVVTFYSFFNLKPQGKHTITVCRGTACHTKGSKSLLSDVGLMLNCSKQSKKREVRLRRTTTSLRFPQLRVSDSALLRLWSQSTALFTAMSRLRNFKSCSIEFLKGEKSHEDYRCCCP